MALNSWLTPVLTPLPFRLRMVEVIELGFHVEMYLAYSSSLPRLGPFQNVPSSLDCYSAMS